MMLSKDFLFFVEGIEVDSPKDVIRSCRETGLLDDEETEKTLYKADDRNLTVHTYNSALALEVFQCIRFHAPLLKKWLGSMKAK